MKKAILRVFTGFLRAIYSVIKRKPAAEQISILSRQGDSESLDISMLREELENRGVTVNVLCRRFSPSLSYLICIFRQMKLIAASRVVAVDSYCIPVSVLKDKGDARVVQIWHALSAVKKFGRQTAGSEEGSSRIIAEGMRMHENYDYIIAPSEITAEHFGAAFGYGRESFVKLGLPRIDYILREDPRTVRKIREAYGLDENKRTILYVPTFRRTAKTDVTSLAEAVDTDRYDLLVRLHPLDDSPLPGDGRIKVAADFGSYDLLKAADIVISDYSSFIVEAGLLEKEIYIYAYDREEYERKNGLNIKFEEEAIGKYVFEKAGDLAGALEKPYDFGALRDFMNKYIEVDRKDCTARLADFLEGLLREDGRYEARGRDNERGIAESAAPADDFLHV